MQDRQTDRQTDRRVGAKNSVTGSRALGRKRNKKWAETRTRFGTRSKSTNVRHCLWTNKKEFVKAEFGGLTERPNAEHTWYTNVNELSKFTSCRVIFAASLFSNAQFVSSRARVYSLIFKAALRSSLFVLTINLSVTLFREHYLYNVDYIATYFNCENAHGSRPNFVK